MPFLRNEYPKFFELKFKARSKADIDDVLELAGCKISRENYWKFQW